MPTQRDDTNNGATPQELVQVVSGTDSGTDGGQQSKSAPKSRPMCRAELMGAHSHTTSNGYSVAIVTRDGKFLARGRYQGHQFGVTLGDVPETAAQRLRRLLVELEDDTFVAGREAKNRQLARTQVPNGDLRSLADSFLCDVRRRRGKKTATDYRNRLAHVLDFAESPDSRRRWPKAKDIDREFALQARVFLQNRDVRRNGKPGGPVKKMSQAQVRNCLETLSLVLIWASRADVRQLPPNYQNPVTLEIVGPKPSKDPLRGIELPLETRIKLVSRMDEWQLLQISSLLVIPMRLEDVAGALISDLEDGGAMLRLGTRLGGDDYNKGRVTVLMPLPTILQSLFQHCARGRSEQPLFRSRARYEGHRQRGRQPKPPQTIQAGFEGVLNNAKKNDLQTEQDRKEAFREMLRKMGGVTENEINKSFKTLFKEIGLPPRIRPYDVRHAVSSDMHRAGVPLLEFRYLTLHKTGDIMNCYTGLNPKREMEKYFESITALLDAIQRRATELGLLSADRVTELQKIAG